MIKLYTTGMILVAIITNAFGVSYDKRLNELWTAQFSLPADDPKAADCLPFSYVEIFDGAERVDLFRILPSKQNKDDAKNVITFECEHVLSTLLDDVMFQLNASGSPTDDTTDVINFVLGKQSVANWSLGTCGFTRNFEYKWENENLLNALFSIPKPFSAGYQWTWDTASYPWTLNLVVPSSDVEARILYRKNLIGIEKQVDPANLITRLYGLGYGEGVNQLTIKAINSGIPYIDADTIGTYGVIARIFADRRFESPETLKAQMETILEVNKTPKITYSVSAADIYQITNDGLDKFELGNLVQVNDSETGISFASRVVSISKPDIIDKPGDVQLQISNKVEDINNTISNLEVKASVNETYSQGATNIDSHDFQDNCDNTHGALIKFYLSDDVVRLNKCVLSYDVDNFRAYSGVTKGGGGSTVSSASGGDSTVSSASGGNDTVSSASGGNTTISSASGGNSTQISAISYTPGHFTQGLGTSNNGSGHTHSVTDEAGTYTTSSASSTHSHSVDDHEHSVSIPSHTHSVTIPSHTHSVTIPSHTHSVTIPSHTHSVTIPDHSHDIDHGIYEFGYLPPSVIIKVDGNTVTGVTGLSGADIDIVPYLTKTGTKVSRGQFHTVEVIPAIDGNNPKGLARIYANVVKQVFIKSVGGGDY